MLPKMPKPRKRTSGRSKQRVRITPEFLADICELILEWRGPLTWENIVKEAERVCGHPWTRQGLNKHEAIRNAYLAKTTALTNSKPVPEGDIAQLMLLERIERLEIENRRLCECVRTYDELFIRYQANAHRIGISPAELEKPLEPTERRGQRAQSVDEHEQGVSLVRPVSPRSR